MELGMYYKNIVVTGGSSGIGYATAKEFLKEGANVAICGRDPVTLKKAVDRLTEYGKVIGYIADGSKENDLTDFAEKVVMNWGSIDVWVNNIGTNIPKCKEFYTNEEMSQIINTCFKSTIYGTNAAVPHMKKRGGAIINVSSLAARIATSGKSTIYAAMKSAIVNVSINHAVEYARYGIRVNSVMPGYTKTSLVERNFEEKELRDILQYNLLKRMADPSEIARPIVFLASDAASYITGTNLEISGGQSLTLKIDA
ncbi:MAG: SDR family NAD(P)-dependent oxidoreductase [Lachnospiraceae bacterium]|nr:SDR family NAD(P)-dependent oxidoreductase [Lachnospiraceae bacterium]